MLSSTGMVREIVDEYVKQGFGNIFLRSTSPYGSAAKNPRTSYNVEEFLAFYTTALDHIITLNRHGIAFAEVYAKILLTKILTPYATGYVDLQSPCGAANSTIVYHYNGDVYASDESRMLAEMHDHTFRLANVNQDSPASIVTSPAYQYLMGAGCNETLPGCAECAFQCYCGADPVRHHSTQGYAHGHRPTSDWCRKNKGIITALFRLLRTADRDLWRVFYSSIRDTSAAEGGPRCD